MQRKQWIMLASALACALASASATAAVRKVEPYELPAYWLLTNTSVNAMVPNSGPDVHQPGCVSVRFTIGPDGQPHDVELGKVEPPSSLGPTAIGIVKQFRYVPSPRNRLQRPVATYYTVQFNLRDKSDAEKRRLTEACALAGYGQSRAASFTVE
ncbi:MAG TPA: energy transducer TonB [Rhodanobacteraceae bacterium]|nr:energy transducer TonB [Rhodanobacteraceae bacterium]